MKKTSKLFKNFTFFLSLIILVFSLCSCFKTGPWNFHGTWYSSSPSISIGAPDDPYSGSITANESLISVSVVWAPSSNELFLYKHDSELSEENILLSGHIDKYQKDKFFLTIDTDNIFDHAYSQITFSKQDSNFDTST